MLGLYLGALLFGGILIGVSILLGGGDHDMDKDLSVDADPDVDGGADVAVDKDLHLPHAEGAALYWLPFLSLRFWTFGSASFGFVGLLLHFLLPWWLALVFAAVAGLGVGSATAALFRRLRQDTVTADTGLARFVGQEAKVVLAIRPGGIGKILVEAGDGHLELLARTGDEVAIERGARVLVASVEDGTADVTSLSAVTPPHPRIPERTSG